MKRSTRILSAGMLLVGGAAIGHRVEALVAGAPLASNLPLLALELFLAAGALLVNLYEPSPKPRV